MPKRQDSKRSGRSPQRRGKEESPLHQEQEPELPYKCEMCGAEFSHAGVLEEHRKTHDTDIETVEESGSGVFDVPVETEISRPASA